MYGGHASNGDGDGTPGAMGGDAGHRACADSDDLLAASFEPDPQPSYPRETEALRIHGVSSTKVFHLRNSETTIRPRVTLHPAVRDPVVMGKSAMSHPISRFRRALCLKHTLPAKRERVYRAWTKPSDLQRWFGPEGCQAVSMHVDARKDGSYRFQYENETCHETTCIEGGFRQVRAPVRLVYSWNVHTQDGSSSQAASQVTVDFLERRSSTNARITHRWFSAAESLRWHQSLWLGSLHRLEQLLEGKGSSRHKRMG